MGTNGKALLRGASDVDAHARRLADAIGAVHAGAQVDDGPLTIRERMVLAAVRSGGSAGQMAAALGLSRATLASYLSQAIVKTGARDPVDAARIAAASGWL